MYTKPESPLSIGGVLDDGIRLTKASYSSVVVISIIGSIIGQLPNMVPLEAAPGEPAAIGGVMLGLWFISIPITVIIFGAIIAKVHAISEGVSLDMKQSLGIGTRRFFPMLFCGLLLALAIAGGLVLLIIPGIIFMVSLGLSIYLVITDKLGPLDALKTSHRLVWGHWWRTLVILSVMTFAIFTLFFLVGMLGALSLEASTTVVMGIVGAIVAGTLSGLVNPVFYALSISLINDLKLRKQGDDLAARIGDLDN